MDMFQSGVVGDVLVRRERLRRDEGGRKDEDAFYDGIERANGAARRLLVACAIGVASVGVVVATIAVSAAPQGVMIADRVP